MKPGVIDRLRAGSLSEAGKRRAYQPRPLNLSKAFVRGVNAARAGASRFSCTYSDIQKVKAWEAGWDSVK